MVDSDTEPVEAANACPVHPSVHREQRDIRFRRLILILATLIGLGVLVFYCAWKFFQERKAELHDENESTYPLAASASRLPAPPRLEQLDRAAGITTSSLHAREQANLERLNSFGPSDEAGYVHIPIRDAMRLVVPKLPVRKALEKPASIVKDDGLEHGGDSNSGRVFRKTQQ